MSNFQLLMNVMRDLYQAHTEMLEIAKNKKQILIEGNIEELSRIMNVESQWVKRVGKLEDERIAAVEQLLKEKGIVLQEVTMNDLVKMMTSPQEKEQLQQIRLKLTEVIQEIQKLNDLNSLLIQQSLDYISNSIETVMGEPKNSYTYGNPISVKPQTVGSRRGFFDQKA
ncbi:flagellar protein FlgN [Tepidibacillus sp. LV47]|uniref:flagellar protein FlgN n=1 Tax=Tepidibacillus sp. LV47 TaxID=3398228 RepID=UPI003AAB808F